MKRRKYRARDHVKREVRESALEIVLVWNYFQEGGSIDIVGENWICLMFKFQTFDECYYLKRQMRSALPKIPSIIETMISGLELY